MDKDVTQDLRNLALFVKASGGGLWDYDIDGDALHCNDRWYEILGLDPAESLVQSIADFRAYVHPDDRQAATTVDLNEIDRLLAQDEKYGVDFRIIRPGGEIRWLRSVACLVRSSDTSTRHAVGCVTDITEFRLPALTTDAATPSARPILSGVAGTAGIALSSKERECLMWVSLGKTAWETAGIIGRSRRTVEFHLNNATVKLNASNKIHATALAIRQGLL